MGWRRAAAAGIVVLAMAACGGDDGDEAASDTTVADAEPSAVDEGADALLAELGPPDAFVLEAIVHDDGSVGRMESWSYYDADTQIDLVDGAVLWHLTIDPLPDGSLLPLLYDPTEFEIGMSVDAVRSLLDPIPITEMATGADFDQPGLTIFGGEQIMLGFADEELAYVETFPLELTGET